MKYVPLTLYNPLLAHNFSIRHPWPPYFVLEKDGGFCQTGEKACFFLFALPVSKLTEIILEASNPDMMEKIGKTECGFDELECGFNEPQVTVVIKYDISFKNLSF